MLGTGRIIGIDLNPSNVGLARTFGMTDSVNPSKVENVVDHINSMTDWWCRLQF